MSSELIAVCIVVIVGILAMLYTLLYMHVKEKEMNDLTASKVLDYEYETEMANGKIISIKKQLKVNGDINVFLDIGIIGIDKMIYYTMPEEKYLEIFEDVGKDYSNVILEIYKEKASIQYKGKTPLFKRPITKNVYEVGYSLSLDKKRENVDKSFDICKRQYHEDPRNVHRIEIK